MKLITLTSPACDLPALSALCNSEDAILLCQDAVYLVKQAEINWPVKQLYVLESDLLVRQLSAAAPWLVIDASRWVELTIAAGQTILWQP